ncbi:unnamed protein product, partial [Cyprideis torosa]
MSRAYTVQVYGPLQIRPRNITLIPGASRQVSVKGGPLPSLLTDSPAPEFSVGNVTVAGVNDIGLVTASHIGSTSLTAMVRGMEGKERVTYSKEEAHVRVVKLSEIQIVVPASYLQVGE